MIRRLAFSSLVLAAAFGGFFLAPAAVEVVANPSSEDGAKATDFEPRAVTAEEQQFLAWPPAWGPLSPGAALRSPQSFAQALQRFGAQDVMEVRRPRRWLRRAPPQAIDKPIGTFSASGALNSDIYANPNLRGVLIRTSWASVEPRPGVFDFSSIALQAANVESHGLPWSLAVAGGGVGSPAWLTDPPGFGGLGVPYISYSFRGQPGYRLPLFWDPIVQDRLRMLANALAAQFSQDPNLKLVYVTQMTANGIEGHLQGVDMADLIKAGYSDALWIQACENAARSFAYAFANKAIAFEVHEVNRSAAVPATIINDLWNDPTLGHRVGAAMWWISGKVSYQPDLIAELMAYPGDIYGQVIGRSDQTTRFENGDYTTVFTQAMALGMRYIEAWEYEFKYGPEGANGAWDSVFASYNAWADGTFGSR